MTIAHATQAASAAQPAAPPNRRGFLSAALAFPVLIGAARVLALPAPSTLPAEWAALASQVAAWFPSDRADEARQAVSNAYRAGASVARFYGFAWAGGASSCPVTLYFDTPRRGDYIAARATGCGRYTRVRAADA